MKIILYTCAFYFYQAVGMQSPTDALNPVQQPQERIIRFRRLRSRPLKTMHKLSLALMELDLLEKSVKGIREDYFDAKNEDARRNLESYTRFKEKYPHTMHPVEEEIKQYRKRIREIHKEAEVLETELNASYKK